MQPTRHKQHDAILDAPMDRANARIPGRSILISIRVSAGTKASKAIGEARGKAHRDRSGDPIVRQTETMETTSCLPGVQTKREEGDSRKKERESWTEILRAVRDTLVNNVAECARYRED